MSDRKMPQEYQNLRELSRLLRDRSRWPENFEWDYSRCTNCAIALWQITRGLEQEPFVPGEIWVVGIQDVLLDLGVRRDFSTLWHRQVRLCDPLARRREVTPDDVADAVDALLSRVPQEASWHQ